MNKFVRNLLTEWRKLNVPFSDETIVVAISGGADSVSLALALHDLKRRKKLNHRFIVAHFNHNLRGIESETDAEFVRGLTKKLGFEFKTEKGNISQKGNLEQNARIARYYFLNRVAEKNEAYAILTAHTKNDQAETFLLNLIRGSGLQGLSGMKDSRFQIPDSRFQIPDSRFQIPDSRFQIPDSKFQISDSKFPIPNPQSPILMVRPLLNWAKREDTESFCNDIGVEFRQDAMNQDLKYSRVRIRKEIIPLLKKINPSIIDTLSQTANLLRESAEDLEIKAHELSENLSQNELKMMSNSMRMRLLRAWLEQHRGDLRQIDLKHLEALERLIMSPKSGRIVELPLGEKVIKKDGKLYFEKRRVEKS